MMKNDSNIGMAMLSSEGSNEHIKFDESAYASRRIPNPKPQTIMHNTNYVGSKFASGYDLKDPALMQDSTGNVGRRPTTGGNYGMSSNAVRKVRDLRAQVEPESQTFIGQTPELS